MVSVTQTEKTIVVSMFAHIRNYRYHVHMSKKTGRLLRITAGCRTWYSFEEALDHYRGVSDRYDAGYWTDAHIGGLVMGGLRGFSLGEMLRGEWERKQIYYAILPALSTYARRRDAITTLRTLRVECTRRAARIQRRNKAARSQGKKVKG